MRKLGAYCIALLLVQPFASGCRTQRKAAEESRVEHASAWSSDIDRSNAVHECGWSSSIFSADSMHAVLTADSIVTPEGTIYGAKAEIGASHPSAAREDAHQSSGTSLTHQRDSLWEESALESRNEEESGTVAVAEPSGGWKVAAYLLCIIAALALLYIRKRS